MRIKNLTTWALLAGLLLILSAGCGDKDKTTTPGEKPGSDTKTPVATTDDSAVWIKVNGHDITKKTVQGEIAFLTSNVPPDVAAQRADEIKRYAMELAVRKELLDEEVQKEGLTLEPGRLDKEIATIMEKVPSQEEFKQWLTSLNLDDAGFRKLVERNLLQQMLIEKKVPSPEPTEEEIQKSYEQVKPFLVEPAKAMTHHILIQLPPGATDEQKAEKKKLAESVRARLAKGEDFAKVAAEVSDSPTKAQDGKESFIKGRMGEDFDNAVFSLKPGELSKVIETDMGYHIVLLDELVPEKTKSLEDVRDYIVQKLKEDAQKKQILTYIDGLVAGADITYVEPLPPEPAPQPMPPGMQGGGAEGGEPPAGEMAPETAPETAPAPEAAPAPTPEQPGETQ